MFIGNINYVLVAVVGGAAGRRRARCRSATCRRSSSTRGSSASRSPRWPAWRTCCSPGVASAERVFAAARRDRSRRPDPAEPARPEPAARAGSRSSTSRSATTPDRPLIEDLSLTVEPGQTVAIVGPTGAGKTTLVNLLMRFYEVTGGRITARRRRHRHDVPGRAARAASAWCCRTPGCSAAPSRRTSPTARDGADPRADRRGGARPPTSTGSSGPCPTATTRCIDDEGAERQRGREAAHHHRPGVPGRAGDPDPGRGDQLGRHPHRGADPAGDELAARAAGPASSSRTGCPRSATPTSILVMEDGADRRAGHARRAVSAGGAYARLYAAQFAQALAEVD